MLKLGRLPSLSVERRVEVHRQLSEAASPGVDFFVLVILSCAIATFGLMTDSPAVIIGAMLVAPLMSPILGLSLASVSGQRRMFERAVVALIQGAGLAVLLSAFLVALLSSLMLFSSLATTLAFLLPFCFRHLACRLEFALIYKVLAYKLRGYRVLRSFSNSSRS